MRSVSVGSRGLRLYDVSLRISGPPPTKFVATSMRGRALAFTATCPQAHAGKVFDKNPPTIVRRDVCCEPEHMLGQDLQVSSCLTNARNVCNAGLVARGLLVQQEAMHRMLGRLTDFVGKARSNSSDVLVLFEFNGFKTFFAMLTKGIFSPKIQMWALFQWSEENGHRADEADLRFPFRLRLASARSRLCQAILVPNIITSDEFAMLVEQGGACKTFMLQWEAALDAPDLLTVLVVDRQEHDFGFALGRPVVPRDLALSDLRELHSASGDFFDTGRPGGRRAAPQTGRAGTGGARGRTAAATSDGPAPAPLEDCDIDAFGSGLGDLDDIGDSDVQEMLVVSEPDVDPDAAEERGAESPAAQEQPVTPEDELVGPSPLGYYRDTRLGRDVFRVSGPFSGNSMGVKCFLHPQCSLAITSWKLPPPEKLKEWIRSVRPATC